MHVAVLLLRACGLRHRRRVAEVLWVFRIYSLTMKYGITVSDGGIDERRVGLLPLALRPL